MPYIKHFFIGKCVYAQKGLAIYVRLRLSKPLLVVSIGTQELSSFALFFNKMLYTEYI
jgi:hypothetical protein